MAMFGVRDSKLSDNARFFVGEDDVLWDWLHADNVEPADNHGDRAVAAPVGYVFNSARALVKHLPSYGDVRELPSAYPAFTRRHYLRTGTPVPAKSFMLLSEFANVLTEVSAEDFEALQIDESRILDEPFINREPFKD
jgi:hypothetical protein